jgi:hypothetical protein
LPDGIVVLAPPADDRQRVGGARGDQEHERALDRRVNRPGRLEYRRGHFGDVIVQVTARTQAIGASAANFFECRPEFLLEGYEARIDYGCEDGDPTRPARCATGAFDERHNARRLVSRDLEPFTLTVVAGGRHPATWVNGHQVTDWVDNRPADENPRRGLRAEPGTIQLQAHDPQTDVEFRSIRVGDPDTSP